MKQELYLMILIFTYIALIIGLVRGAEYLVNRKQ
jgi:hypothetical protein